jgi:hypothetical protein
MGSTFRIKKLAPFEPMKHAHLKYVTWKTAFLIAITSFGKCNDLQALIIGINFPSTTPAIEFSKFARVIFLRTFSPRGLE